LCGPKGTRIRSTQVPSRLLLQDDYRGAHRNRALSEPKGNFESIPATNKFRHSNAYRPADADQIKLPSIVSMHATTRQSNPQLSRKRNLNIRPVVAPPAHHIRHPSAAASAAVERPAEHVPAAGAGPETTDVATLLAH
jgi:hypothetical protein